MASAKDRLDELIDRHAVRNEEAERKKQEAVEAARNAAAKAKQFSDQNIRPILDDYAATLQERGHYAAVDARGDGQCILRVVRAGATRGSAEGEPYLGFIVAKEAVKTTASTIMPGRGGRAGQGNYIERSAFSEEFVHKAIIDWLDEVMFGTGSSPRERR